MFDFSLLPQELLSYVVIYAALLIFGISKGGFGGGLGALAVPMILYVLPTFQTIGMLLPILCLMDLFAINAYRGKFSSINLKMMMPACVAGILLGSLLVGTLNSAFIKLSIGLFAIFFTVSYFIQRTIKRQANFKHSAFKAGFWGMLAGLSSMLAHAGGPPANFYLLPQKMEKTVFVGTTVYMFAMINFIKLPPYIYLGIISWESLQFSLIALPAAPAGIYLGIWLKNKFSPRLFYLFCYTALFLTGLKLVFDAVGT